MIVHILKFTKGKDNKKKEKKKTGNKKMLRHLWSMPDINSVTGCTEIIHFQITSFEGENCHFNFMYSLIDRAQFHRAAKHKYCLAWNFFRDKNRITNQISICCILIVTGNQLLFAYPENHVETWWVFLFLSRKKFHAKQTFMLSSSMKLGPGQIDRIFRAHCWALLKCTTSCPTQI